MEKLRIRRAANRDLPELERLESAFLPTDRFTQQQIDYLLARANATVLVLAEGPRLLGAAYLLWRKQHRHCRLYSIAIDPMAQGRGLGARLLQECEREAVRRACDKITLEVRADNATGIALYTRHGYRELGTQSDYYDDGQSALRMEKALDEAPPRRLRIPVPYYSQSLGFTCGPACLMMVARHLDRTAPLTQLQELRLWKESTLIYTTAGVGGTGPYGLALSAQRRGASVSVISSTDNVPFLTSVRSEEKRNVIRLIHHDMRTQAIEAGVSVAVHQYGLDDVCSALQRGELPIILISTSRLTGDREPHWVVVTGYDKARILIHDPDHDPYRKMRRSPRHLGIPRDEFEKISRYGKKAFRCALFIGPKPPPLRASR